MRLRLSKNHPVFVGHFPGHALAPGVVILDYVIHSLREKLGHDVCVTRLPLAKFNQALLPETVFLVHFDEVGVDSAKFKVCGENGEIFASGQIGFQLTTS